MTKENQEVMRTYPVFKLTTPEELKVVNLCSISDINIHMVEKRELKESYISQYHCDVDGLVEDNIMPTCQENKFPLDAFVINSASDKDEVVPVTDYCHLKGISNNEYISKHCWSSYRDAIHDRGNKRWISDCDAIYDRDNNCGRSYCGFPNTDAMNGYNLIPITDENREAVYTEFKEKGFLYEDSYKEINFFIDIYESVREMKGSQLSPNAKIEGTQLYSNQLKYGVSEAQIWSEYVSSEMDSGAKLVSSVVDYVLSMLNLERMVEDIIGKIEATKIHREETTFNEGDQTWSEYASSTMDYGVKLVGNVVDCVMDISHCLDFQ